MNEDPKHSCKAGAIAARCSVRLSRAQPCAELGNLATPEVNTNAVLDPTASTANLPSNTARNLPLLKLPLCL